VTDDALASFADSVADVIAANGERVDACFVAALGLVGNTEEGRRRLIEQLRKVAVNCRMRGRRDDHAAGTGVKMADQVRWFELLGTCRCGKAATGTWRGPRNESYGLACSKCGPIRVVKAEKERERETSMPSSAGRMTG